MEKNTWRTTIREVLVCKTKPNFVKMEKKLEICLMYFHQKRINLIIIIDVYVDDFIVLGRTDAIINKYMSMLETQLRSFKSQLIFGNCNSKTWLWSTLIEKTNIEELLKDYQMSECNKAKTAQGWTVTKKSLDR